ncbi:hypothetical protein [Proteiniborus sp.]
MNLLGVTVTEFELKKYETKKDVGLNEYLRLEFKKNKNIWRR